MPRAPREATIKLSSLGITEPRWDRAALCLILFHAVLLLSKWPLLPFFLDVYYHLNVANGFREAGGIVLHDFWELAPLGRAHIYPPALHIAILSFDWLGLSPITLARIATVLPYPILLLVVWWFARAHLGSEIAYWVTLCGVIPFSYLLVICNSIAASWAIVFWLIGLVAFNRRAMPAFVLSSALVFYTHAGIPWIMVCSWLILGTLCPGLRRRLAIGAFCTLLIALPWLMHLWVNRASISMVSPFENRLLEIPVLLYVLATAGIVVAVKLESQAARAIVLSVFAGLLPLAINYRFRFFSGQGLLGFSLLAALSLTALHQWLKGRLAARAGIKRLLPGILTIIMIALSPTVFAPSGEQTFRLSESSFVNLLPWGNPAGRSNAESVYSAHLMDPLVDAIREHSGKDELIGCSIPYICALFSALSSRASVDTMFVEALPDRPRAGTGLRGANLIVWFKAEGALGAPTLSKLQRDWGVSVVGETDLAYVLRNPQATEGRKIAQPIVSLWVAKLLFWAIIGLIVLFFRKKTPISTGCRQTMFRL